jgi:MFS family permease
MLDSFDTGKDRSTSYLQGEGATSSIENAGMAYQAPSLLAAGASAGEVALLSTITNLFFALLLLKVPSVVKFGDSLKRTTVILGVVSALAWLPLILVPIFIRGVSPLLLLGLWVVSLVPSLMIVPLRDKWLSDIVPSHRLGRYLSFRSIISAGTYLSFFYVMGWMLDRHQFGVFNGFTLIFAASFLGSLISFLLYRAMKEPVSIGESQPSRFGLFAFIREAKQNDLGIFIVFSALIIFSASVSTAFFSVYLLRDLHFTYFAYTLVISVEFLARIAIAYLCGKWVDNAGALKVLRYASFMIPAIPIFWLFSSNIVYLMGIQVFSGIAWAAFDLSTQSYLCRGTPQAKRLHYIVYNRSIVTLAAALGPLLGMLLLNVIFPVFGNAILGIFLLSGILRLLTVIVIMPRLKEAETDSVGSDAGSMGVERSQVLWSAQTEIEQYHAVKTERKLKKAGPPAPALEIKRGLFYHPELWDSPAASPVIAGGENARQDLLYRSEDHSQRPVPSVITRAKPDIVSRLKDHISTDPEYLKKWSSRLTYSGSFDSV